MRTRLEGRAYPLTLLVFIGLNMAGAGLLAALPSLPPRAGVVALSAAGPMALLGVDARLFITTFLLCAGAMLLCVASWRHSAPGASTFWMFVGWCTRGCCGWVALTVLFIRS